ncbi:ribonuclease E inhibitor RraB [Veronia pacifica]|uniref:Regulator of ribonuclease activity B domain-containing protein n=1 Tax=Veronia pacifica TaxID=1080227 RepID=A0A1C3EPG9_9GAMM|nr:ribonuclease E inhibitor RraB [Veronia pacifica]ODA35144.1 hypothetical protein A8L45_05595 [Veronia pacifica]
MNSKNIWPEDADGDAFRILEQRDFDFGQSHEIEFSIDFPSWPLTEEQQKLVLDKLPEAKFTELEPEYLEEDDNSGYVSFFIKDKVTYELIVREQKRLSDLFSDMDGYCNSWSVCSPCGG